MIHTQHGGNRVNKLGYCVIVQDTEKNSDLTTLDRATTSLTLRIIKSSTCTNHFSTAPLASDVEIFWIS